MVSCVKKKRVDHQMQDNQRSGMAADISYVEGAVPPDMLLKFPEEDLENLRRILYLDKIFVHRSNPPNEILERDLFQAIEAYKNEDARLAQAFVEYFTPIADPASDDAGSGIEGTSVPRLSEAPKESAPIHGTQLCLCLWVDQCTKQICQESVPTGKPAMLSHLNKRHGVCGSETDNVECQWVIFHSGSHQVCGKKFQRRNTSRHIASHLRLRAFCLYCDKDFSRPDQLAAHVRVEHRAQRVGGRRDTK
ncbi:hypothetical protein K503DRAFT_803581 [Rhizopogon vinicolor AM-OR11-026]|uniref:C2H2-type domain-containing protein n=1 Tax=Rhizopogon vinicolor AM-OR11-026 TaxID=1314800 RepID=A0A1B7MPH0_9AGAM|nr:hypothetical protein K503DRAFT_803581 [Rhizopogon vinicolor AM-OR11-026]